ncbi:MAG: PKD domain-containing protein, partial [Candidatus Desantisbacteria bacterium]
MVHVEPISEDFDDENINNSLEASYIWDPAYSQATGKYDLYFYVPDGDCGAVDGYASNVDELWVKTVNTPPIATFTVIPFPSMGTTGTTFMVDASGSCDNEDETGTLRVRWDWESDGVWDCPGGGNFIATKTASHKYPAGGSKKITMEAIDTAEETAATTHQVTVINQSPYTPFNPSPSHGTQSVPIIQILRWEGGDTDTEDTITYYIYFGTSTSLQCVSLGVLTNYSPGTLNHNTRYYWKIIAIDSQSGSAEGPIWEFTTTPNTPPMATFTITPNTGTVAAIFYVNAAASFDIEGTITLSWQWETGSNWTESTTTRTASHQYPSPGTKTITLMVTDMHNATVATTMQVNVVNQLPVATFTVMPIVGTSGTIFTLNAAGSTDPEGMPLTVEWMIEDGSEWTVTTSTSTVSHQYLLTPGTKTITLKVKDPCGGECIAIKQVQVINQP